MLRLLAHPLARPFALFAAMMWLWSTSASEVHHILVKHVVCAEHGELSEVRGHGDTVQSDQADHPSIAADAPAHPDHGCAGLVATPDRAPPVLGTPRVTRAALLVADPLTTPAAPRGPPLAYAPKTSPPLAIG